MGKKCTHTRELLTAVTTLVFKQLFKVEDWMVPIVILLVDNDDAGNWLVGKLNCKIC